MEWDDLFLLRCFRLEVMDAGGAARGRGGSVGVGVGQGENIGIAKRTKHGDNDVGRRDG